MRMDYDQFDKRMMPLPPQQAGKGGQKQSSGGQRGAEADGHSEGVGKRMRIGREGKQVKQKRCRRFGCCLLSAGPGIKLTSSRVEFFIFRVIM